MSLINVTNIKVGNNVCSIKLPLIFQIEFECLENLKHDVEWKIIYITSDGSGYVSSNLNNNTEHSGLGADNSVDETLKDERSKNDELENQEDYLKSQNEGEIVLDAVCLGPVQKGILEFEFRVNPPNFNRLKPDCILGMQAILITGSYCDQEFIRIGYYTNNTYDEESLRENPPDTPILDKVVRCIIDQPRVTRFPIKWDNDDLVDFEGNRLNFFSEDSKFNSEDSKSNSDESKVNSDYERIDDDTTYLTDDSEEDLQLKGDETNRYEAEDIYEQDETTRDCSESTIASAEEQCTELKDNEGCTKREYVGSYPGNNDQYTDDRKYTSKDEYASPKRRKEVNEESGPEEKVKRQCV